METADRAYLDTVGIFAGRATFCITVGRGGTGIAGGSEAVVTGVGSIFVRAGRRRVLFFRAVDDEKIMGLIGSGESFAEGVLFMRRHRTAGEPAWNASRTLKLLSKEGYIEVDAARTFR